MQTYPEGSTLLIYGPQSISRCTIVSLRLLQLCIGVAYTLLRQTAPMPVKQASRNSAQLSSISGLLI